MFWGLFLFSIAGSIGTVISIDRRMVTGSVAVTLFTTALAVWHASEILPAIVLVASGGLFAANLARGMGRPIRERADTDILSLIASAAVGGAFVALVWTGSLIELGSSRGAVDEPVLWLTLAGLQFTLGLFKTLIAQRSIEFALAAILIASGTTLWLSMASSLSGVSISGVTLIPFFVQLAHGGGWGLRNEGLTGGSEVASG